MNYQNLIDYCKANEETQYVYFYNKLENIEQLPPEIVFLKNALYFYLVNGQLKSIPAEIGKLSLLEDLVLQNNPIESVSNEIIKLKKLRRLDLSGSKIKDFSFLKGLSALESLSLNSCSLDTIPEEIRHLQNLKFLQLEKNNIQQLPPWMTELTKLDSLLLSRNPIKQADDIEFPSKITYLALDHCQFQIIPPAISKLKSLYSLKMTKNKLQALPDWLGELETLLVLHIEQNPFVNFPEQLGKCVQLQQLYIDAKWLNAFPYALLNLVEIRKISKSKGRSEGSFYIHSLAKECYKKGFSWDFSCFLMDVLAQRFQPKTLDSESLPKLLQAMDCNIAPIRESVQQLISTHYEQLPNEQKIGKGSCLAILGQSSFNIPELRARLEKLGIGYSAQINEKVTHLLVGKLPKKQVTAAIQHPHHFLTEKELIHYLNEADRPYLLDDSTQENSLAQLSALLLSEQEENVLLALRMLQTGGLPPELLTDLVIVYFSPFETKTRQAARKLLEQYGPRALYPYFSKGQSLLRDFVQRMSLYQLDQAFEPLCAELNLDKLKFLNYINQRPLHSESNQWAVLSFLLKYSQENEGIALLNDKVINGSLSMTSAFLDIISPNILTARKISTQVKSLALKHCKLRKIPDFVFEYKQLEILDLSNNPIKKIPKEISALKQLKHLFFSSTGFVAFPEQILQFTELETLSLNRQRIKTLPMALASLKKLRSLSIEFNLFAEIPEVLFEMSGLEELTISQRNLYYELRFEKESIEKLAAALPNCKIEIY